MATNINVTVSRLAELGGASNTGVKLGFLDSAGKTAINDTFTFKNVTTILAAFLQQDSDGVSDPVTISGNVATLTRNSSGATSGFIIFK